MPAVPQPRVRASFRARANARGRASTNVRREPAKARPVGLWAGPWPGLRLHPDLELVNCANATPPIASLNPNHSQGLLLSPLKPFFDDLQPYIRVRVRAIARGGLPETGP